jgi:rhodanese-related sulfurtransferase
MDEFNDPELPQVTAEDVKKALDEKEQCILLDVRTPAEYQRGKIEGSINVPVDMVEDEILSVIPDKSAKIYVYCLSGSRSIAAVFAMIKLGYTNVFDMSHGLLAWRAKYFPVVA